MQHLIERFQENAEHKRQAQGIGTQCFQSISLDKDHPHQFNWAKFGICLYLAPIGSNNFRLFFSINRSYYIVAGYIGLATASALIYLLHEAHAINRPIFCCFLAYILIISGSIATLSINPLFSSWFLFAYVLLPFLIGTVVNHQVNRHSTSFNLLLLSIVLVFVLGENVLLGINKRAHIFGSQANSVQLSLVCAFVLSFVFSGFQHGRIRFTTLLFLVFFAGLLSGVILPRWFLLATFLLLPPLMFLPNSRRICGALIGVFIVGWILALVFLDSKASFYTENIIPRSASINARPDFAITSIEERINFIFAGFELFLKHPFQGVGVGNFGLASGRSVSSFPHFSIVHILSEVGIFTLTLYIAMIGYGGFLLFRAAKIRATHIPWLMIFIYGIVFSILHGNYLTDKLIYMALGYASSLKARSKI